MGYIIHYQPESDTRYPRPKKRVPLKKLCIAAAVCAILLSAFIWAEQLWMFLLPGDGEMTSQAMGQMVENLRSGTSFSEAVTAFCSEILEHGQF